MTRPMPGPPESWDWDGRSLVAHYPGGTTRLMPAWWLYQRTQSTRLSDAEAAAEYWRALRDDEWDGYVMWDGYGPPQVDPRGGEWWSRDGIANEERRKTWHRFATCPHALEGDHA